MPRPLLVLALQLAGLRAASGQDTEGLPRQTHRVPAHPTTGGQSHSQVSPPPPPHAQSPPCPLPAGATLNHPSLSAASAHRQPLLLDACLHLGMQRAHITSFLPGSSSQLVFLFLLFFPKCPSGGEKQSQAFWKHPSYHCTWKNRQPPNHNTKGEAASGQPCT